MMKRIIPSSVRLMRFPPGHLLLRNKGGEMQAASPSFIREISRFKSKDKREAGDSQNAVP